MHRFEFYNTVIYLLDPFNLNDSNVCFPCFQGEAGANVLVGIQVPSGELNEFRYHANNLGYEYELETDNEAFQLLMR